MGTRRFHTQEDVFNACRDIHNNEYTYHQIIQKSEFITTNDVLVYECKIHGIHNKTINDHIYGKTGCPGCGINKMGISNSKGLSKFIEMANIKHNNKFDYSLTCYKNDRTPVKIICPIHGMFTQQPGCHLISDYGCKYCGMKARHDKKRGTNTDFIKSATLLFNDTFDYSMVNYISSHKHVDIICRTHGVFQASPSNHLRGKGNCPKCSASGPEIQIMSILKKLNISYIYEYKNPLCIYKHCLPFDFYIQSHNLIIEYDGPHHFYAIQYRGHKADVNAVFESTKRNDAIKNEFCKNQNITLLRIPYTHKESLNDIISEALQL